MGLAVDLDLSGYTDRDQVEAGENVPAGWYRANVADHYEDHNKEGTFVFEFRVAGGTYDGKKLFFRLTHPSYAADESKAKMARDRIGIIASRLGLIADDDLGKTSAGVDFDKAIGRECVVRVVEQKSDRGTFYNIGYAEVYPLDHHKIPKDVRVNLQLPAAREPGNKSAAGKGTGAAAAVTTGTASRKDDFADL